MMTVSHSGTHTSIEIAYYEEDFNLERNQVSEIKSEFA